MRFLNLSSLESRRIYFDISILYKILNNLIDSPDLLASVGLRVYPTNARNKSLFNIDFHRTNYGVNSPLNRMCNLTNNVLSNNNNVDIFSDSLSRFTNKVKQIVFNQAAVL